MLWEEIFIAHKGKLSFVTLFPQCQNIHLVKDVGMIPYVMHRDMGYDSYVMCYENGDYPYLDTEVPGLKMIFIDRREHLLEKLAKFLEGRPISETLERWSTLIDASIALLRWGRVIDVLQLYHLNPWSILAGLVYRIINPKGILYLKLDMSKGGAGGDLPSEIEAGFSVRYFLFDLAHFDIITVETREMYAFMRDSFPFFKNCLDRLRYLPNGVDTQELSSFLKPFSAKKKEILHVGRLGDRQKASDLVLKAFSNISEEFPDWRLCLIGSLDESFLELLKGFKLEHPSVFGKISCLGFVERNVLYKRYSEAEILMAPSRWESFGLVVAEAMALGDVLLGSDIPPFKDMTDGGKLGYLCPIDSVDCLTGQLRYMLSHKDELQARSGRASGFIRGNFDWRAICSNLDNLILQTLDMASNEV